MNDEQKNEILDEMLEGSRAVRGRDIRVFVNGEPVSISPETPTAPEPREEFETRKVFASGSVTFKGGATSEEFLEALEEAARLAEFRAIVRLQSEALRALLPSTFGRTDSESWLASALGYALRGDEENTVRALRKAVGFHTNATPMGRLLEELIHAIGSGWYRPHPEADVEPERLGRAVLVVALLSVDPLPGISGPWR